ncbi:MAG: serine hydrolase [Candidatus Omnitrophica bacterium]|nr:serine hydrolase [Candidatus Omnitrophota bacterium]
MAKQDREEQIDQFVRQALERKIFPGAVLGIVNDKKALYKKSFGYAQLEPDKIKMKENTIFDLASLTKVMATTIAVMQLIEKGKINLWDYIKHFYPEFPYEKKEISIFHLLTHTSGFPAIIRLWDQGLNYKEKIKRVLENPLEDKTGEKVIYSDLNFILLGDLIWRVTGKRLDKYASKHIFQPLGMTMTTFNPLENLPYTDGKDYAATEMCEWRGRMMIGEVHDENAFSFGGVSGHAGLFSTIDDLNKFLQMLLNNGLYQGIRVLSSRAVGLMSKDWTPNLDNHRGLGWDLIKNSHSSGGVFFSEAAFGHTGFTGTSIWIDPLLKIGVALLTNRVHPTRENKQIIAFRPLLHNLVVNLFCNS